MLMSSDSLKTWPSVCSALVQVEPVVCVASSPSRRHSDPTPTPPLPRVSLCPHKKCEEAAVRPQRHGHLTTGEEGQPPWTDPLPRLPQLATLTAGPALTAADLWH